MSVTIRPADRRDILALAELIEEIERFYGSTQIQPLAERQSQVEPALFGSPPMASALLVEDETSRLAGLAVYSFLWPPADSSHSLFLNELYVRDNLRRQGVGAQLMKNSRPSPLHVPDAAASSGPPTATTRGHAPSANHSALPNATGEHLSG
ncbi:GNAT family N-acetyltransferase [Streptomyces milbemycinicus]|uniref:GNAT family N-acetyltransferase n=1 Tax=Streptomyces milbemycinicus TaxID=476552 RepID=UPI0033C6ED50